MKCFKIKGSSSSNELQSKQKCSGINSFHVKRIESEEDFFQQGDK